MGLGGIVSSGEADSSTFNMDCHDKTESNDSEAIDWRLFLETQQLITCNCWYRRQEFKSGISSSGMPGIYCPSDHSLLSCASEN